MKEGKMEEGEEKDGGGRVEEGRREGRVHPCTKQALLLSHLCVCVCVCVRDGV